MKTQFNSTIVAALLCAFFTSESHAQTSAFTYQGRLTESGMPASGTYDLRFTIYDSANSPGTIVAGPITNAATEVSNGLFTVTLDFGSGVFDGNSRWLEIEIATNGGSAFANLSPRQPLTSAPYAVRATSAGLATAVPAGTITSSMLAPGAVSSLDSPNGLLSGVLNVSNNGLVGVGTKASAAGLEIAGGQSVLVPTILSQLVDGQGSFTNLDDYCRVVVEGNRLAITEGSGVALVDITDPTAPVLLADVQNGTGNFSYLSNTTAVALSGGLLAVGTLDGAVTLIDVSTPSAPVWRSSFYNNDGTFTGLDGIFRLNLTSNLLAIAAINDGTVTLVDVSNPANPIFRSAMRDGQFGFNALDGAAGLARRGNLLAIAAAADHAVSLVDVSNPANPQLRSVMLDGIGGYTNLEGALGLAFDGNVLAIGAVYDNAVTLVDVSNPTSPVLLSSIKDGEGGFDSLAGIYDLAFSGQTLWVAAAGEPSITALDASNPSMPASLGATRGVGAFGRMGAAISLALSGNVVIAGASQRVSLLDSSATSTVGLVSHDWVGIGVSQPVAPLHVRGNVVVEDAEVFDVNAQRLELGDAIANGENSVAIADGATASGRSSFAAIGGDSTGTNSISMGWSSTAAGEYSVAIGRNSLAQGARSIAMGSYSSATKDDSIALGYVSEAQGVGAIALGNNSRAGGDYSLAVGRYTKATGDYAAALGYFSEASGTGSSAIGNSRATNYYSTAAGLSSAFGQYATALGYSSASSNFSTALGNSTASGSYSVALGRSKTTGDYGAATGYQSTATNRSFAAGTYANAAHSGCFVWSDSTLAGNSSTAPNQFCIRASGGVHLATDTSLSFGNLTRQMLNLWGTKYGIGVQSDVLYARSDTGFAWFRDGAHSNTQNDPGPGGTLLMRLDSSGNLFTMGAVNPPSDRNMKTDFRPVQSRDVLDRVLAMPVQSWAYTNSTDVRHLGPVAQDFYAAFGLGTDDKHIATVDADGVALAAIQGLDEKVEGRMKNAETGLQELRSENAELKRELTALQQLVQTMQQKLKGDVR